MGGTTCWEGGSIFGSNLVPLTVFGYKYQCAGQKDFKATTTGGPIHNNLMAAAPGKCNLIIKRPSAILVRGAYLLLLHANFWVTTAQLGINSLFTRGRLHACAFFVAKSFVRSSLRHRPGQGIFFKRLIQSMNTAVFWNFPPVLWLKIVENVSFYRNVSKPRWKFFFEQVNWRFEEIVFMNAI